MRVPALVRIALGPHNRIWEDALPAFEAALQAVLDRYFIGPAVTIEPEYLPAEDSSARRRPTPVLLVLPEDNALPKEREDACESALQAVFDRFVGGPAVAVDLTTQRQRREQRMETARLAA